MVLVLSVGESGRGLQQVEDMCQAISDVEGGREAVFGQRRVGDADVRLIGVGQLADDFTQGLALEAQLAVAPADVVGGIGQGFLRQATAAFVVDGPFVGSQYQPLRPAGEADGYGTFEQRGAYLTVTRIGLDIEMRTQYLYLYFARFYHERMRRVLRYFEVGASL